MKKSVIAIIILAVIIGGVAFNSKFLMRYYMIHFGTDDMFVSADQDDFDKGPQVGATMPAIKGIWQGNEYSSIDNFAGTNGTVFVVNRSLEWCPFCMRQSIELQNMKLQFDEAGIAIVMMTYDSPDIQQIFIDRHNIEYPVLSDVDATSFTNLAVLREEYGPDHAQYGLGYPGMIVVDKEGIIKGKLFIEAYSYRVDTAAVLNFAKSHLL